MGALGLTEFYRKAQKAFGCGWLRILLCSWLWVGHAVAQPACVTEVHLWAIRPWETSLRMNQTQPACRSRCKNSPEEDWGRNFALSAVLGAHRHSKAIVLLLPKSSWNEAVFNLRVSFVRILYPSALESHRLASTTPLCFIITTAPGGPSCWNFLSPWINSGVRISASSSGIVPVSGWVSPWPCYVGYCLLSRNNSVG